MATEKAYTILVSGLRPGPHDDYKEPSPFLWQELGQIPASSPAKAIEKLWEQRPELKVDTSLRYVAIANFTPKRQRRSFVEKWALDDADLPDDEPPGQMEMSS